MVTVYAASLIQKMNASFFVPLPKTLLKTTTVALHRSALAPLTLVAPSIGGLPLLFQHPLKFIDAFEEFFLRTGAEVALLAHIIPYELDHISPSS